MILDRQKDDESLPSAKDLDAPAALADGPHFRRPVATDGAGITALIARCPPLDRNSAYCNLIQCTHFADHCIVAEMDGRIVGWVSGHRLPSDPQTFFVWQVAVAREGRGNRLASRMIEALLARPAQRDVTHLITTVTDDNQASWALFHGLARDWGAPLERSALFESDTHFGGAHPTEHQARIGPIIHSKFHEERG